MTRTRSFAVCLALFSLFSPATPALALDPEPAECTALPPNIEVSGDLEPIVALLLAKSRIFRRQCAVIASADVRVRMGMTVALRNGPARARAIIGRTEAGAVWASIEVPPVTDYPELLAHELEHVIEQVEGLDLKRLAQSGTGSVLVSREGAFETVRAIAVGRAVAHEFHAEGDPLLTGTARSVSRMWRVLRSRADREARCTRIRAGVHKEF